MSRPHPATYSDAILPVLAEHLQGTGNVLDPMGGSGKLAVIKSLGYSGSVVINELEPEWKNGYAVDAWHFGDAAAMTWAGDQSFEAICTSPVYGNRMGDKTLGWTPGTRRITYDRFLGHAPSPGSTIYLQWDRKSGDAYRAAHVKIYQECLRVLQQGGTLLLNISDHIRGRQRQAVAAWHRDALFSLGLQLRSEIAVQTPRMRYGKHYELRVESEQVFVFRKP